MQGDQLRAAQTRVDQQADHDIIANADIAAIVSPDAKQSSRFMRIQRAFQPEETAFEHLIIQTVRLPRVLAGVLVGIALAVAGAIMQALTRNPLADSGILGINAGAAFAVVVTVFLLRVSSLGAYALAGMVGAAAAGVLVYG